MNKIIAVNYMSALPCPISQSPESELDAFCNNTFKHEMGKLIAISVIANLLKVDRSDINFTKNAYGKPTLAGQEGHVLDFNLSYTGSWIFLAISTEANIGIDAELIEPINIDTASEFCVGREIKMIKSNPDKSIENYYKLWTLRESFLKIMGVGLSYPIKNIEFIFNKDRIKFYNKNKVVDGYFFKVYKLQNILISLCIRNKNFPEKIEVYNSLDSFNQAFNKNQYQNVKNYAEATT
ncbi:MAG: hypothetical protein A2639_00365 [Candidatus Staskawiczbacteria bacterium RIFCSPHIGHO2_01_FULL_34_27]|uniref:Uncharacterized protein n=2 Tax=Candidatus Staskawicziibacteriota TaxID=1817916 RepID=A0A1G2HK06_9BACT|nr:MAG: hypothetical protein A2639_00365 [Candidatus Staskawiczbacteria bacterium RIFCSPHIGHO2_01_FULL_34_27]OGZ66888.1 MAG: hypothetical protein A3D34_01055 [Candidatus Staskawiczbacteria bacterium RIFCSPHIGHO2_02_FULL_33_16]